MGDDKSSRYELATQVVVAVATGAVGLAGPVAAAVATGATPLVQAAIDHVRDVIGHSRLSHQVEIVMDGAETFGAETFEAFKHFIDAAISDDEHRELLARALITGQDAALRDKRRALGRALASAASDTGTRVNDELLFIRVLADLDEPHIRLLRLMQTFPKRQADRHWEQVTWEVRSIAEADPGLGGPAVQLLRELTRHGLVFLRAGGIQPGAEESLQYSITPDGDWLLARVADPADGSR
jgi:hypothetical protein